MFATLSILFITLLNNAVHSTPPFLTESIFNGDFEAKEFAAPAAVDPAKYLADQKAYRLPSNVIPEAYKVNYVPNLSGDFKFTGDVKIRVLTAEDTSSIILHSHKLDILSVKVSDGSEELESEYVLLPQTQMLKISMKEELAVDKNFFITIKFQGILNDNLVGFYRSRYESNGVTKWIATTQFEPTYARMAFPCFDEPRFRSEFSISIARYKHQRVISNMPLQDTSFPVKSLDDRVIDYFRTTPPMPTYLVAFTLSEFYFIANAVEKFRVWARQEAVHDGQYALAQVEEFNDEMEEYLLIQYDLPKLDLAAIPDFDAGAMENWGLTTYREPYVLYCEKSNSSRNQEDVSSVVAHELAHQWYGNYVTLAWWDYLWLNEGFATYFQYLIINLWNENWRMKQKMVVEGTHSALAIDGISVHRPLNALVNTPSEISGLFDAISYQKGAAIIHMIANYFGFVDFRRSMRIYLRERYEDGGVATPSDLYNILEGVRSFLRKPMPHGTNLFLLMEQFADQVGYPLLTVTRHPSTFGMDIKIKQTPYRSPRSKIKIPDQIWTIPISCANRRKFHMNNKKPEFWSYTKDEIVLENAIEESEWYICNVQQTGYFRVNYDNENWNLIKEQLLTAPEEIHPINRAQIMDDSYTFALDDLVPFSTPIGLMSYLKYERDAIPWYTGIRKLQNLYTRYEATIVEPGLKRFVMDMLKSYFDLVGFDPHPEEDQPTSAFRNTLAFVACNFDVSDCVPRAMERYYENENLSNINGNVLEAVLCTAMKYNSTMKTWNRLWKFYKTNNTAIEKETVLLAFGCATNEDLHKKYLFKLVDDQDIDIRPQNYRQVVKSMLRFYRGVTSTLKFIREMLPNISRHKKAQLVIIKLLANMKSVVKSEDHVNLLDNSIFEAEKLDQQKYGDLTRALKETKTAALSNIQENERRVPEIRIGIRNYEKYISNPSNDKSKSIAVPNYVFTNVIFALSITLAGYYFY